VTFCRQIFVAFLLVVPATAGLAAQGGRAPRATSDARAASAGHALKATRQHHGGATSIRSGGGAGARGDAARAARGPMRDSHIGSKTGTDHAKGTNPATSSGARQSGTNTNPIDVHGGLPGPKDASPDTVHQKVEEAARQVRELQQRLTATKSPHDTHAGTPGDHDAAGRLATTPQAASSGAASAATKSTLTGPNPTNAGASSLSAHGPPSFTPTTSVVAPGAGPSGAHPSTTAAISGTGMTHAGTGPAAIGGSARVVTGVNGSTVRAKR
jgi:hypothetical protein